MVGFDPKHMPKPKADGTCLDCGKPLSEHIDTGHGIIGSVLPIKSKIAEADPPAVGELCSEAAPVMLQACAIAHGLLTEAIGQVGARQGASQRDMLTARHRSVLTVATTLLGTIAEDAGADAIDWDFIRTGVEQVAKIGEAARAAKKKAG